MSTTDEMADPAIVEPRRGSAPSSEPLAAGLDAPVRAGDSKVDVIVDRLLTAIGIGEYLPGARLPAERALAASLEVSRGTVRDAIAVLVDQGVLERRRGRDGGSFVLETGTVRAARIAPRMLEQRWNELVHLIDAGSRLHESIVRAAAQRRTAQDLHHLQRRLEAFRGAETGRPRQLADEKLHGAIGDAAHLPALVHALSVLERQISTGSSAHLWGAVESHRAMEARALADHERLVELIEARDVDSAGALARRHAMIDLDLLVEVRDAAPNAPEPVGPENVGPEPVREA